MEELTEFKFGKCFNIASRTSSNLPQLLIHFLLSSLETQSWGTIQGDGVKPTPRRGHSAVVHENSM